MANVKVATKKQSPTSTAVFLVDIFVSPSSGYGAGFGMRLVDWLRSGLDGSSGDRALRCK